MGHQFGADQLERDVAIELAVVSEIDLSHSALPELPYDVVARIQFGVRLKLCAMRRDGACRWWAGRRRIGQAAMCSRRDRNAVERQPKVGQVAVARDAGACLIGVLRTAFRTLHR